MAFHPNFVSDGDSLKITLISGETSTAGAIFVRGGIFGVANKAGVEGDEIIIQRCGIHTLDKTTGTAWEVGTRLFWNASTGKAITTDQSGIYIGVAAAAAASSDSVGNVALAGESPQQNQTSQRTVTITGGDSGAIADARVTATSHVTPIWATNTTKSGPPMVVITPGTGYRIYIQKVADATTETGAAGTMNVLVHY